MSFSNLLIEIGTEELPPSAIQKLRDAFAQGIAAGLAEQSLSHGKLHSFASPRRLAVMIEAVQHQAADREVEALGPPADRAKEADGSWSKAALGFARKNGVDPAQLQEIETPKGIRLGFRSVEAGQSVAACLADIVNQSVSQLPIPKRMRWGAGRTEFVRPVHWIVMLLGDTVIEAEVLGIKAGNTTRGHRFHSHGTLTVTQPEQYAELLRSHHVIADFQERRELIREQVKQQAAQHDAVAVIDEDLLDEVTGLVEWPVALTGSFEERFLQVPAEALVYSMKEHQKYFHLVDAEGQLLPRFITISNIESKDPGQVIDGNQRVIRPRLSDADFFFNSDKKTPLADRVPKLETIVFQQKLGTLLDKSRRLETLAGLIAAASGCDETQAQRAALLGKADLITDMVGEFADMQGIAGRYYALHDGEDDIVADAIEQQYWPRFAGDRLPTSAVACCVALADRLDTLVGIFGIGQAPTGSRDPFALRRASLGVLRIMVEREMPLDLRQLLEHAAAQYPTDLIAAGTVEAVLDYMLDRFRAWYEDENIPIQVFMSVAARKLSQPLDIHRRVHAVHSFAALAEAQALAAANKRVSNILEKQDNVSNGLGVSEGLLQEPAEQALAAAITAKTTSVAALLESGDYAASLATSADLRQPVDAFFDQVMVMADDLEVRNNRLQLLQSLRELFLQVADISHLVVTR